MRVKVSRLLQAYTEDDKAMCGMVCMACHNYAPLDVLTHPDRRKADGTYETTCPNCESPGFKVVDTVNEP